MLDTEALRAKTVEAAIKSLKKDLGDDIITPLSEVPEVAYIPTRLLSVNHAIGLGGIPIGLVTELIGGEGCGKTTLALSIAADAIRAGYPTLYIDLEGKVRQAYAAKLGVPDTLELCRPANGDQAMMVADKMIEAEAYKLVIIDSVALLSTGAECEKGITESNMMTTARLLSQSMKRLMPKCRIHKCALLFINQYRQSPTMYGNPNKPSGGLALQYASSLTLEMRDGKPIRRNGASIGKGVTLKVTKNQVGMPSAECELTMLFGSGFDDVSDLFETALTVGALELKGSWVAFNGENIVQGRENCIDIMRENAELFESIKKSTLERL